MVMKSIRKKFIEEPVLKMKIIEFLEKYFSRVWIANIDIKRSPIETRIYLEVMDPRGFMNKRSRVISRAAEMLSKEFNIDNPKISLIEIRNPWLEPRIVARKAAKELEMGKKARAILYKLLNNIMQNGAVGAEIVALGKIGAKGAKSKKVKVYAGFVPKAGNPVKDVRTVHYATVTKSGVIGITVRIAPPGIYLPDKMDRMKKEIVIEEGPAKAEETKEVATDAVAKS
ncbi:MAG: 30S ribosomal protein S3 [Candidatus Micrarchaeota archaeon]|nr:30S ribosomal protein S3 [Candidatus Micrarchaeota archaeon]